VSAAAVPPRADGETMDRRAKIGPIADRRSKRRPNAPPTGSPPG